MADMSNWTVQQQMDEARRLLDASTQQTKDGTPDGETKSLAQQQLEVSQSQTIFLGVLVQLITDRGRRPL